MNIVVLCGRLTRDPDTRMAGELKIARYALAVDRKKKDEADFINIVTFGKAADFAEGYLKKGTKVIISGRIQTGSYTNKNGEKVNTVEVVADSQEFAESKKAEEPKDLLAGFLNLPEDNIELPFH